MDIEFKTYTDEIGVKWVAILEWGKMQTPIAMLTLYEFERKMKDLGYVKAKKPRKGV